MLKKKKLKISLICSGLPLLPYNPTGIFQCLIVRNLIFIPFLHFHRVIAVDNTKLEFGHLLVTWCKISISVIASKLPSNRIATRQLIKCLSATHRCRIFCTHPFLFLPQAALFYPNRTIASLLIYANTTSNSRTITKIRYFGPLRKGARRTFFMNFHIKSPRTPRKGALLINGHFQLLLYIVSWRPIFPSTRI